ncbi:MAG: response regulator [bacterium]|nr:response regulator [bacterium]MDP3963769.1 response regulator [bacterium]
METQSHMPTVLIVEDEGPLLKGLGEKFTISGFGVFKAANGSEGLALALAQHPDVIIMDVLMPNVGGFEMLQQLRADEWGRNAKAIIWSNSRNLDLEKEARELGVADFWVKSDFNFSKIVEKVRALLDVK